MGGRGWGRGGRSGVCPGRASKCRARGEGQQREVGPARRRRRGARVHRPRHPDGLSACMLYLQPGRYAHPLDLLPLVDLNLGKVIHIECYDKPAK